MDVYIVMTDSYPGRPTVAFLDEAEAVGTAARLYGLAEDVAASRVVSVPVLSAYRPATRRARAEFLRDGTVTVECQPDGLAELFDASLKGCLAASEAPSAEDVATD